MAVSYKELVERLCERDFCGADIEWHSFELNGHGVKAAESSTRLFFSYGGRIFEQLKRTRKAGKEIYTCYDCGRRASIKGRDLPYCHGCQDLEED